MEPFGDAYYHGMERSSKRYQKNPPKSNMLFTDIKHTLEHRYNDFPVVFVKDMAYYLSSQMGRVDEVLPEGYQHTFLIRHPSITVASLHKACLSESTKDFDYFDPAEAEFKSIRDLFVHIEKRTGETPVVVNATDLLENPARMLKKYCTLTGLPFSEDLLKWNLGGMQDLEDAFPGWQKTIRETTGFLKPQAVSSADSNELPKEAKQAIEDNMKYYRSLYEKRMRLDDE